MYIPYYIFSEHVHLGILICEVGNYAIYNKEHGGKHKVSSVVNRGQSKNKRYYK